MEDRSRNRKRARARKRRQRNLAVKVFLFIIIIVGIIGGAFLLKKYGPTKEKADLNEYYGIQKENQLAVIVDNEVLGASGIMLDGKPYVEYSVVRDYLNGRFYVDFNENILLYTLPQGTIRADVGSTEYMLQKERKSVGYTLLKMEGSTAYISLDCVQEYTNIDFQTYEEPNRVMIISDWGETTVATVKRNTQVRYRGGVKSPILTNVSKKDVVTVIEDEDNWKKVRTEDGYVGYMKTSCLKNEKKEQISSSREFKEQEYKSISKDYTINLAWHDGK